MKNIFSFFLLVLIYQFVSAQSATITGKVVDPNNKPIQEVRIVVKNTVIEAYTNQEGKFNFTVPVTNPQKFQIIFAHPVHDTTTIELELRKGYTYDQPVTMQQLKTQNVLIQTRKNERPQMMVIPIRPEEAAKIPTMNPSVEAILLSQPGVVSNNEFSSQYRVRGGNFDENLVYVNGIEVYRPFLARSGQMEGLGFANRAMTDNIAFSTGGFPAQYGDRLSSVLDITYRSPKKFMGSAEVGIINNALHIEGVSKNKKDPEQPGKFTYLVGARHFSLSYFLNSLTVKGNYKPRFMDIQGMFTYTPKRVNRPEKYIVRKDGTKDTVFYPLERLKFTGFVTTSRNRYAFSPQYGESSFGTIQQAFRLQTAFEGRELSTYNNVLGAIMAEHRPSTRWKMNYILSGFRTEEAETFDVEGGYRLSELNTNFGSEEFGEESQVLGTGSAFRHGRNYLNVSVLSAEAKGEWINSNQFSHKLYWGAKIEQHFVDDQLKEYNLIDSAQYVIDPFSEFNITEYLKGSTNFTRTLVRAYIQEDRLFGKYKAGVLTYGVRLTYDSKINVSMTSPRVQFVYDFSKRNPLHRLRLRAAAGVYHQPPFYREFRAHDGSLNFNLTPQTSIHLISGVDYTFTAWGRDFRLFSEAYYKYLYNVIPYEVQNVRIRYYPEQQVPGYAYGLDLRLNGEFIKGLESWLSASYLDTRERLSESSKQWISRPTNQRFTFAMYFQDELPINPTYKAHINFVYGTGMRAGVPFSFEQRTLYGFPSYQRVDLGFSKMILFRTAEQMTARKHALSSWWATVEIFNLFGRQNTISYEWIKDVNNQWLAVPQHLSARMLNVRMIFQFQ